MTKIPNLFNSLNKFEELKSPNSFLIILLKQAHIKIVNVSWAISALVRLKIFIETDTSKVKTHNN